MRGDQLGGLAIRGWEPKVVGNLVLAVFVRVAELFDYPSSSAHTTSNRLGQGNPRPGAPFMRFHRMSGNSSFSSNRLHKVTS